MTIFNFLTNVWWFYRNYDGSIEKIITCISFSCCVPTIIPIVFTSSKLRWIRSMTHSQLCDCNPNENIPETMNTSERQRQSKPANFSDCDINNTFGMWYTYMCKPGVLYTYCKYYPFIGLADIHIFFQIQVDKFARNELTVNYRRQTDTTQCYDITQLVSIMCRILLNVCLHLRINR